MATDVQVPTLGESVTEATLGEWLKQPGDAVAADEPIASLETDKVAVEVPSPEAGVIEELLIAEGDAVEPGQVIAKIRAGPPEPPLCLGAPTTIVAPVAGSLSRLARHSIPNRPEGSQA